MKKPYAESTLKKKYRETGIPKQVLDKLHLYLTACASFYKVLNIDEVWKAIQRTERRLSKMKDEEFFGGELVESIRFYLLDEFQRQLQDELLDEEDGGARVPRSDVYDEMMRREEEYERKEKRKIMRLAEVLVTPLISESPRFTKFDYELTREDFDRVIAIKERSCDRYFIFSEDELYEDFDPEARYLVDISTVMKFEDGEPVDMNFDDVYEILDRSVGKPLYVPEDLLNYIYFGYYERTPQTDAMEAFLRRTFFSDRDMEDEDAEVDLQVLMKELHRIMTGVTMSPTEDINQAVGLLEEKGHIFKGFDQTQQFIQLFMDMSNHTRQPVNKGNSPAAMIPEDGMGMPENITFGPGIQDLLRNGEWDAAELKRDIMTRANLPIELRGNMMREIDKALEPGEERVINATGTIVKGRKIKPNEPCPCGSGRKYKHCCGRH